MKVLPRKPLTQRQRIARSTGLSDRQLTRWIRFIEANSLDWLRCSPDGATTPRTLHPFQAWLLRQVLQHRTLGREWLAPILLNSSKWSYSNWVNQTENQTA